MRWIVSQLTEIYAPDVDTAWLWLRTLHDYGYEAVQNEGGGAAFKLGTVTIEPWLRAGLLRWVVKGAPPPAVYHADPVTAAVWWDVEKGNMPPEEQPKVRAKAKPKPAPWEIDPSTLVWPDQQEVARQMERTRAQYMKGQLGDPPKGYK